MDDDIYNEDVIRQVVLPYLKRNYPNSFNQEGVSDSDLTAATLAMAEESPPDISHPAKLLFEFVTYLPHPDSTDTQWQLGRRELAEWYRTTTTIQRGRGQPEQWLDRIILFAYIEWRIQLHEDDPEQAVRRASDLFDVPLERLEGWFLDKHRYPADRMAAHEFVSILRLFTQGTPEEQATFLREKAPFLFE